MNTDLTSIQLVLLAVGSIGAAYSLLIISRARASNGDSKVAHGFFIWPNTISAVITLLVIISILAAGWTSLSWALRMSVMLAVGWAIIFQVFRACRSAGRKLTCDVSSADNAGIQSATGYNLLSASGLFSCSMALFGMVVTLLVLGAAHRDHEAAAVGVLLALTGGFWLAGTFWSFSSALYRGLLAQDTEVSPTDLAYLCVRFRSASGEMAFLAVAGLAAAMAMGIYHYPGNASAGLLFPLGAFGASIVCGILAAPLLKPRTSADTEYKQNRWLFYILGMQVFLAGTGAAAYVLATTLLGDPRAFYTYGIGLLTAMLLILTARYRPPFMNIGSPFGTEIAVAEVLMVIACQLLSFQWLGGYGVALCAVGLLSSFAITFPLGALWAIRTGEDDLGQPIDLPFLAHAASRFTEIVMAGGSFLLVVVFLRLYYESAGLQGVGIDITDAYPLMGLVIGGGFPTLLRTLSLSGHPGFP